MENDNTKILDAALGVFMRYGFKRTTMGDIAQAVGISRQSLYARFANKDEVYAAGVLLYGARTLEKLETEWATCQDLTAAMDAFATVSVIPTYHLLRDTPDAADLIAAAASADGNAAMAEVSALKRAALSRLFEPYADRLAHKGLTPDHLADFVETSKHSFLQAAADRTHLDAQLHTLKASVLALTAE